MAISDLGDVVIDALRAKPDDLMSCEVARLEELFAVSGGDVDALRTLQDELRYRQAPRALVLLKQIRNVLDSRERREATRAGRLLECASQHLPERSDKRSQRSNPNTQASLRSHPRPSRIETVG